MKLQNNMNNQQNNKENLRHVQTILVREQRYKSNGLGTAGFITSLLGLLLSWVPVLGWILWLVGALLSLIGVFKSPRGLAITGIILSLITLGIGMLFVELISSAFK